MATVRKRARQVTLIYSQQLIWQSVKSVGEMKPMNKSNNPDKKRPQTIDGETGKADPTPRRIDLSTLRDVRLELAAVYRKMDSGQIESQEGTRRAYVLKTIHDAIVSAELERRIDELEQRQSLSGQYPALGMQPLN